MNRDQLLRKCLVITCFLEHINTSDIERLDRLVKSLRDESTVGLKKYYEVNLIFMKMRVDKILGTSS